MSFHKDLIGQDLHAPSNEQVENQSGSTIAKFKAVYFTGLGTSLPKINLANGAINEVKGITQTSILDANTGYITAYGVMTEVDTSLFVVNDNLYANASGDLSTTINGRILAQVLKVDATFGIIYVLPPGSVTSAIPTAHASTHLPSGSDPLTTAAPVTQAPDQANAIGTANSFARSDHIHNIPADVAISIGSSNAEGTSTQFSRADHLHQGVHSLKATSSGTTRFNDVILEQGTNITIVDSPSGTFTFNSANQVGTGLKLKSGTISAGSFSGSPKKATVTFSTPFASTAYSITITGTDNRTFTWESKLAGSFVINANANASLTGNVDWQAIATGESN